MEGNAAISAPVRFRDVGWWILIVDDDGPVRWSLRERLQERGYCVLALESGQQALKRCRDVELAVLDYRLRDADDGLALAKAFKRGNPSCAVVLMTARHTPTLLKEASESDVRCVMGKAFDLDQVVKVAGQALSSARTRGWAKERSLHQPAFRGTAAAHQGRSRPSFPTGAGRRRRASPEWLP